MASDMVERVRLAIEKEQASKWNNLVACRLEDLARAAIEAMREPTEAMESAFFDAHSDAETFFAEPGDCWRAMIDAALQESSHVR